jgi:hypothetical protein
MSALNVKRASPCRSAHDLRDADKRKVSASTRVEMV